MSKTFTAKEKAMIRDSLIQKGRELFGTYGLRKTNVGELAKAAGIAQGSFYSFFDSKEELYLTILEFEQADGQRLLADAFASEGSAEETLYKLIRDMVHVLEINPILRNLFDNHDYELVVRKLPLERLEEHQKTDNALALSIVTGMLHQKGVRIDIRPEVIAGLLRAIAVLSLHKDEIGTDLYPEVMELLAMAVAKAVVGKGMQAAVQDTVRGEKQ